ncbi:GNAT family N-acetyltransferase [Deinococcus gobiensis]|uniref:N-acetyltransferase domain-containing protein n=1 Tax=Deinococcus gobiensis (strain DSM 21396 / JCM 16679 / CGMCC 1.7299 / I-0) TaxID=745776 RepID=H8GZH1_DEIGI|nr:GNAT family N-acetyltransferase [Deinococcus gobiensis]AFD26209.1 hypothetical protein DGo_CA2282 [Deinococcus gobiensis I-0]
MVRPRRDTDLPALCAGLREVHAASGYPSVWPADPAAFLAPPALGAWVAELDGVPAGQVTLRPADEPLPAWVAATGLGAAETAVVSRLFVAPAARGRGLARALLRAAWAEARAQGRRAVLDVHTASAAAIGLYEAEGWVRVATMTAPWHDPDGTSPQMHVYVAPT